VSEPAATAAFITWLRAGPGQPAAPGQPAERGRPPEPGQPPELALPDWLAQVVTALFQGQDPDAAADWAGRVQASVTRLRGRVPFTVVHDWHAGTVVPLLDETGAGQAEVGALHAHALAGTTTSAAAWTAVLERALPEIYRRAYGYADAWQVNYASAVEYGTAHDFGEAGTIEYANYYADLATAANQAACADANAVGNAAAWAVAFAAADPAGYAAACPYAATRAYALAAAHGGEASRPEPAQADAGPDGLGGPDPPGSGADHDPGRARYRRERAAYRVLADGLAASLDRAAAAGLRG
jgi:hypothetical protein